MEENASWLRRLLLDGSCHLRRRALRGVVDLVIAGFPCQPFSRAGKTRKEPKTSGGSGPISSASFDDVGPRFVFLENPTGLFDGGVEVVLGGLASIGFDAVWDVFSAAESGATHERERVFILAVAHGLGQRQRGWLERQVGRRARDGGEAVADADGSGCVRDGASGRGSSCPPLRYLAKQWPTPTAQDYGTNRGGACGRVGETRPSLSTIARGWPTPLAHDGKGGSSPASRNESMKNAAKGWATPMVPAGGAATRPKKSRQTA